MSSFDACPQRRWLVFALVAVALAVAVMLGMAGCGGYDDARGRGDAPVGNRDDAPADVINFPDTFGNVATKCDRYGHRLFVVTHVKTDPTVVVIVDPTCSTGGVAR
jgi:hypothetical protein